MSKPPSKSVSVIILNYQGEKIIHKCLESVISLDYPKEKLQIIVVDNASTDGSRRTIENIKKKSPGIVTIFNRENVGFSKGNNIGIRQSKGEYVLLLNNDCLIDRGALGEMVACMEKDRKIFAVNPKIFLGDTNRIQSAGINIFKDGYARERGSVVKEGKNIYEEDKGQYDHEKEIDAACGAAVLYKKSILDEIGLLDEEFFMYYEDVEIGERAKKAGYKNMYYPKAVVRHLHAASSGEWSPFFIYHSEKGRLLHLKKHFPKSLFLKEYLKFVLKAKARLILRIWKPSTFAKNWQYIKVAWYFLINP